MRHSYVMTECLWVRGLVLDYLDVCGIIGPTDLATFVAGYDDYERWRSGQSRACAHDALSIAN